MEHLKISKTKTKNNIWKPKTLFDHRFHLNWSACTGELPHLFSFNCVPFKIPSNGAIMKKRRKLSEVMTRPKQSWIFCSLALWISGLELTSKTPMLSESQHVVWWQHWNDPARPVSMSQIFKSSVSKNFHSVMWTTQKWCFTCCLWLWSVCHWLSRNAVWRARVGLIWRLVSKDLLSICFMVSRMNGQHHSRYDGMLLNLFQYSAWNHQIPNVRVHILIYLYCVTPLQVISTWGRPTLICSLQLGLPGLSQLWSSHCNGKWSHSPSAISFKKGTGMSKCHYQAFWRIGSSCCYGKGISWNTRT